MGKYIDLTGKQIGYLKIIKLHSKHTRKGTLWECVCQCGATTIQPTFRLNSGNTKSCGCMINKPTPKHGMASRSNPSYNAWSNMKARCNNKNNIEYPNYGGRGINVCDRWIDSFENFYADMGDRPSKGYSLDRINVDGDYEPSNCRWATVKTQSNNTRRNIMVTYKNQTRSITEWSEITGIHRNTIKQRLHYNWPIEKALTTPVRK